MNRRYADRIHAVNTRFREVMDAAALRRVLEDRPPLILDTLNPPTVTVHPDQADQARRIMEKAIR